MGEVLNLKDHARRGKSKPKATYKKDFLRFDDELDRDKVYPDSTDSHGHSDTIQTRYPQGTRAALAEIREACPQYRGDGDVIRSALHHHLHYLRDKLSDDPEFNEPLVTRLLRISEMERGDRILEIEGQEIDGLETRLNNAISIELASKVAECMEQAESMLEEGIESPVRRDRVRGLLDIATKWLADNRTKKRKKRSRNG